MANSTKIAIVGLMILLVVVVAKYVKTGTPVNQAPNEPVVATADDDNIVSVNAGNQASNTENRVRPGTPPKPRPLFIRTPSRSLSERYPARRGISSPENSPPPPADPGAALVKTETGPQGLVSDATDSPADPAEDPAASGIAPPESLTRTAERIAEASAPAVGTGEAPATETFAAAPQATEASAGRISSANPPANRARLPGFPKKHKLKRGESPWLLASMYYGGAKWGHLHPYISKANRGVKFNTGNVVTIPSPPPEVVAKMKPRAAEATAKKPAPPAPATRTAKKPAAGKPPAKVAPTTKSSPPDTYIVKAGDSLGDISERLLGSSKYVSKFYEVNKDKDLEFTELHVGTQLRVPKIK